MEFSQSLFFNFCWKRFRDDVFVLWEHYRDDLCNCFNFMNCIDLSTKKIQLNMSCPTDNALEFLDLTLSFDVTAKQILLDIFSSPNNSFAYIIPST